MGKFVITKRSNGEFQFVLKAGNGETILTSEGYVTKPGAGKGIESVRKNSQDAARYNKKNAVNGKFYFTLGASNGQTVGTSEMYETAGSRENGITSVKKNAPGAGIDDQAV